LNHKNEKKICSDFDLNQSMLFVFFWANELGSKIMLLPSSFACYLFNFHKQAHARIISGGVNSKPQPA
jgi:hypothetical protein